MTCSLTPTFASGTITSDVRHFGNNARYAVAAVDTDHGPAWAVWDTETIDLVDGQPEIIRIEATEAQAVQGLERMTPVPGTKVLLQSDPRFAMIVTERTLTNRGFRIEVRPADPAIIGTGSYNESEFICCPDDWQDAPARPSFREGRFEGADQIEAAQSAWFQAAMAWEQTYGKRVRQPRSPR